jgi:hypothetical protein
LLIAFMRPLAPAAAPLPVKPPGDASIAVVSGKPTKSQPAELSVTREEPTRR